MLIQAQGYARTDCKLTNYDAPLPQHRAHTSAAASGIRPFPMRLSPSPVLRRHHGRVQATEAILPQFTPHDARHRPVRPGGNPSRLPAHEETDFGRVVGLGKYVTYESQADEKGCRWNAVFLLHIASSVVAPPDVPDGSR